MHLLAVQGKGGRVATCSSGPPRASVLGFCCLCGCNLCQPAFRCASCMAAAEESLALLSLDMPSPAAADDEEG